MTNADRAADPGSNRDREDQAACQPDLARINGNSTIERAGHVLSGQLRPASARSLVAQPSGEPPVASGRGASARRASTADAGATAQSRPDPHDPASSTNGAHGPEETTMRAQAAHALPPSHVHADSHGRKRLGRILVETGKLTPRDVDTILEKQSALDCSFGKAAVVLGLVSKADVTEALEHQFQYPTLYNDPQFKKISRELVVGHKPSSAAAERIRAMRSSLIHISLTEGLRSLAVVGVHRRAGATYFAANLALAMAQVSHSTLLVEANMRHPRLAEMWGISRRARGLPELLRYQEMRSAIIINQIVPNLSLLPSGSAPPNPQELLSSSSFNALRQRLEQEYEVVIYDTPSAAEYADACVVSARVGAAVVVARRHKTRYKAASQLLDRLTSFDCDVIGTVLNDY